jgi:hypothetical protein
MRSTYRQRRRGTAYLIVLGAAVIVTLLGLSALTGVRIQRRSTLALADVTEARLYARSAIELGLLTINSAPTWRTAQPHGRWITGRTLGRGTFDLDAVDPDGNLSDDPNDPIVLTGTGHVGLACQKISVQLVPEPPPGLDCLASAVHAGTWAYVQGALPVTGPVSCNADVSNGGTITANVAAVGAVDNWGIITGTVEEGATARAMPAATVLDYYLANGTTINYSSIPGGQIDKVLISPASNPYGGGTNAQGIYVVNCNNKELVIKNCRIVGTLVIRKAGDGTRVEDSVYWTPAVENYPAVLVDGPISLNIGTTALSESNTGTNFNPAGTPYLGVSDTDKADTYPSKLKGLIYVSSWCDVYGAVRLEGVLVVAGDLWIPGTLEVTFSSLYRNNPPPGFERTNRPMVVDPGTWKPVVN